MIHNAPEPVEEVAATRSFAHDFLRVKRGLRLPANHQLVERLPDFFEPAPERPHATSVVALEGFITSGVRVGRGDEFDSDNALVQLMPSKFVPATWSDVERDAAAAFRSSETEAPARREEARERTEQRKAARRAVAERRLAEARADMEAAEAELEAIS